MRNIITISRPFGAGGGVIGRKVADRLGYYYCDRDIIIQSAMCIPLRIASFLWQSSSVLSFILLPHTILFVCYTIRPDKAMPHKILPFVWLTLSF